MDLYLVLTETFVALVMGTVALHLLMGLQPAGPKSKTLPVLRTAMAMLCLAVCLILAWMILNRPPFTF